MTKAVDAVVMRTVVDDLIAGADGTGSLTMTHSGEVASWHEIHDRALRAATVLRGKGLGHGSRVGLHGVSGVDMAVALQAVWLIGGCVTVLPPQGREYSERIAADAALSLVLDPAELARVGAERADASLPGPGDLAVLQYTSGSTRAPRGVPVTHAHLRSNVDGIRKALNHEQWHPGLWLSWLPLYHDMGLIAFFIVPMTCGCPLALEPPESFVAEPARWLSNVERHRALISGAPNFAYSLLTRFPGPRRDLSSLKMLVSGGEPIDAAMMRRFVETTGVDPSVLMPCYGLAEATLAATMTPVGAGLAVDVVDPVVLERDGRAVPAKVGKTLVSNGLPVPGVEVRIAADGTPLGPRRVGAVQLRGGSVIHEEWLDTGDRGYLTEGGELVVCGREKDIVFAAGRNIYPQDVEAAAAETPGVRPGGAAAFSHEERLIVAVETRDLGIAKEVRERVRREAGLAPKEVLLLAHGQLPKTTSGKLRRAETRRRWLSGEYGGL